MSRRSVSKISLILIIMVVFTVSISSGTDVFVDMRDSLGSWARSTVDKGDLEDLPKAVVNGDLYEQAHALAELQIAQPALDALDMTYQRIASACDGDLDAKHVTTVFAQTPYGQDLNTMMSSRKIVDDVQEYDFEESCVEVVKCYFKKQLEASGVDLAEYDAYTSTTLAACTDVVTRIHSTMLLHTTTKQISKNNNYGDEIFANGTLDDSPYDLLVTIGDIGDILFSHNETPSKITFYEHNDADIYEFYEMGGDDDGLDNLDGENVDIDPDVLEEYADQDPNELEIGDRLPPTKGVTPVVPNGATSTYVPPTSAPEGWTQGGHDGGIAPSGGSVQNSDSCKEEVLDEAPDENVLEAAEKEWNYVYERNDKLDVDTLIAVALGSKVDPSIEAAFGDDKENISKNTIELAQDTASEVVKEIADLGGDSLDEFKDHVQSCVEQFTDQTKDKRQKILRKSITQPTAFTKCVLKGMCKEIGDESKLGLYRIKICKQPFRGYNINANQPVQSIEEIIDELSNVCYGLRESGQLLKHNKTKDQWTHKLMNIKLGDKFSFGLTVGFQPPPTSMKDHAVEKRKEVEMNKFLSLLSLGFNEELTYPQEKNKYNLFSNPIDQEFSDEEFNPLITSEKATLLKASSSLMGGVDTSNSWYYNNPKGAKHELDQQIQHYPELDKLLQQFVQENTEYWIFASEHAKSMQENRKATYDKFKGN